MSQSEGAVVKRFVYDSMGRIVGEYGAGPSAVRGEYIYLLPDAANDNASPHGGDDGMGGYALLTIMTPDAAAGGAITAQYPHSNHLGAPLFSTDASGTVVTPGDHAQPVFPGQLRTRADLYHNRHRDYDPTTGRYVQADPIGLEGDANPYLYANGNPVNAIDPLGLACNGGGCYTTPAESSAAANGDYDRYYKLACAGGDAYACYARHIAANDNESGNTADWWLNWSISNVEIQRRMCFDRVRLKQKIRKGLAKRYADHLPNDPKKARWPNRRGVSQIHWEEFEKHGLPANTFGGTPYGKDGPYVPQWYENWCPNCK